MKTNACRRACRATAIAAAAVAVALPAAAVDWPWSGGGGDDAWGTAGNWLSNALPGDVDTVLFTNLDTVATGTVNNVVDSNYVLSALVYRPLAATPATGHGTAIPDGLRLTATNLTVGRANSTLSSVAELSGAGELLVTGGSINVGNTNSTATQASILNLAALRLFTATNLTDFYVGRDNRSLAYGILATNNVIQATSLHVANSGSAQNGATGNSYLLLGQTNTLFLNNVYVGRAKSSGDVAFRGEVANGAVLLRDKAGTGRVTLVAVSEVTVDTAAALTSTIDWRGHDVDALIATLRLGKGSTGANTGSGTATFSFDRGIVDATTIELGRITSGQAASTLTRGILNAGSNATLIAATIRLGDDDSAAHDKVHGELNLSGATLYARDLVRGDGNGTGVVNWTGGTIRNYAGTNLLISGLTAFNVSNAAVANTFFADAGRSISVLSTISGNGGLRKDGGGLLVLAASNAFAGSVEVTNGAIRFGIADSLPGAGRTLMLHSNTTAGIDSGLTQAFVDRIDTTSTGGLGISGDTSDTIGPGAAIDTSAIAAMRPGLLGLVASNIVYSGVLGFSRTDYDLGAVPGGILIMGAGSLTGLTGSASLRVSGGGFVVVQDALAYSGGTVIDNSALVLGAGGTSGSITGAVAFTTGGTLAFNRSDDVAYAGLSGAGGLAQVGAGVLLLGGGNTYAGATTASNGTLRATAAFAVPTGSAVAVATGATFDLNGFDQSVGSVAGAGTIAVGAAALTSGWTGASTTFAGVLDGAGAFVKTGAGTLTLGSNGFAGAIVVAGGILKQGDHRYSLGDTTADTFIRDGAQLDLNGRTNSFEVIHAVGSGPDGRGAIVLNSGGGANQRQLRYLVLDGDTTIGAYGGIDTRDAGTFIDGGAHTLTKLGGGTWYWVATAATAGAIHVNGGDLKLETTTTLNTDFALNINTGRLAINNLSNPLGRDVTFNGGGLWIDNGNAATMLTGTVTLAADTTVSVDGGQQVTLAGPVGGAGVLIKTNSGTMKITGDLANSGGVWVRNGSLHIGTGGTSGTLSTLLTNDANVAWNRSDAATLGVSMVGTGIFHKTGPGTLTLAGANAYSGGTFVSNGVLRFADAGAIPGTGAIVVRHGGAITPSNDVDQAFLDLADPSSTGMIALGMDSSAALDFTGRPTAILGATAGSWTYTGALTPGANGHLLGAMAGATLNLTTPNHLTGANALTVGGGAGTVALAAANDYTGGTTLLGGTLEVASDAALGDAAGGLLFTGGVLRVTGTAFTNTARAMVFAQNGTPSGGRFDVADAANVLRLSGDLSGPYRLYKYGPGTLALTGTNNTNAGFIIIENGTLQIGDHGTSGSLGASGGITNFGTLVFARSDATSFGGTIAGTGNVVVASGVQTLSGSSSFTGALTVRSNATLKLGISGALGALGVGDTIVENGGTLDFNGGRQLQLETLRVSGYGVDGLGALINLGSQNATTRHVVVEGNVAFGGTRRWQIGNNSPYMPAVLDAGSHLVRKVGSFELALLDTTITAGTVRAEGGILLVGFGTTMNPEYPIDVVSNAVLRIAYLTNALGRAVNLTDGEIRNDVGSTISSISGLVTVEGASRINLLSGGSMALAGGLAGSGELAKIGANTLSLGGPNAMTGPFLISNGVVRTTAAGALSPASALGLAAGATLDLNGFSQAVGSLAGAGGTVMLGAGTLTAGVDNASTAFAGAITGTGGLVKDGAGALALSGANAYTGPTRVMAGVLELTGGVSMASAMIQIDAGAALVATGTTATLNLGSGQVLKGSGSFIGGLITGSGATVRPGSSPGVLTVTGDWQMDAGSTLEVELNGPAAGTGHDQLAFGGGSLTLNGPDLSILLGFAPTDGSSFAIVTGLSGFDPGVNGTFRDLADGSTFTVDSTDFRIDYEATEITLTVVPEPASLGALGLLAAALLLRRRSKA
jgi:autotransporter-associated beta strand protein